MPRVTLASLVETDTFTDCVYPRNERDSPTQLRQPGWLLLPTGGKTHGSVKPLYKPVGWLLPHGRLGPQGQPRPPPPALTGEEDRGCKAQHSSLAYSNIMIKEDHLTTVREHHRRLRVTTKDAE